jgi:hypothetical protein
MGAEPSRLSRRSIVAASGRHRAAWSGAATMREVFGDPVAARQGMLRVMRT